jgi:cytochrome P450
MLSQHTDVQKRLRDECRSKLSGIDPSKTDAALFDAEQMPYLHAVCNETLRFYPPATATSRSSVRDTMLNGIQIPKGTQAIIPIWPVNRSTTFWGPKAGEFDPQRWLEGPDAAHGGATSPQAFMSFFHGPRSCIGQGFARLEMKTILSALVLSFSFDLAEPDLKIELGGFLISKPLGGLKLKLTDLRMRA